MTHDNAEGTHSVLVTVCTYNERENIELLIPEILSHVPSASILVIDDNSPDGTADYVEQLRSDNSNIHLIRRAGKLGLGTATIEAFEYGIQNGFDLLVNMDADFSHPPRYIPSLIEAAQTADVAICSRYVPGGEVEGWGLKRHLMSQGINAYARIILGLRTRDNSGSFRCFHVDKLAQVDWSQSRSKGYGFQEEILYRLKLAGATFCEVPFRFEERRYGVTKINWREAMRAGTDLLAIRFLGYPDKKAGK